MAPEKNYALTHHELTHYASAVSASDCESLDFRRFRVRRYLSGTSWSSCKPRVEAKIRQMSKNCSLEGSVRRRIEDNINLEGSRGRRIGENCNLEGSRRRWIDRNTVLEGCSGRWIEQKMVLGGSGRVGSTKIGIWRRPGGIGSRKILVWRILPRATGASRVESDCYPGAHRGSIFYMIGY